MSNIAIITARGGSKRIPKKNIKEFCGKPIIAYSIEAAIESGIFDEVMVSTDSEEIADIARKYGASIPFMRSEKTSSDFATTADVLNEVLDEYEKRGMYYDYFSCIYPTAPFVTAGKLLNAYNLLINTNADKIEAVTRFSFPPQRGYIVCNGGIKYQFPEYKTTRSQDLEPIYHDCGQFYIYKTEVFKLRKIGSGITLPFIVSNLETQDIDDMTDWELAELKYNLFNRNER